MNAFEAVQRMNEVKVDADTFGRLRRDPIAKAIVVAMSDCPDMLKRPPLSEQEITALFDRISSVLFWECQRLEQALKATPLANGEPDNSK